MSTCVLKVPLALKKLMMMQWITGYYAIA